MNNFINQITKLFKKNYKIFLVIFFIVILSIILLQFYFYQQNNKIFKLSILYDQAVTNINNNDFNDSLIQIAKENNMFGIFASLELIQKDINNEDYNKAYEEYLILLKKSKSKDIYNTIIALHGSYNLFDYIDSIKISNLLEYVNDDLIDFQGYKKEIQYLIFINDNNLEESNKLLKEILNNANISINIKERIKKFNEYNKYK